MDKFKSTRDDEDTGQLQPSTSTNPNSMLMGSSGMDRMFANGIPFYNRPSEPQFIL
jgi:hypothetical protein